MAQEDQFADFVVEQDYTDVQAWSGEYQLVPQGDYVVDVSMLKQEPSKNNNPTIKATFTIAEADAQLTDEAKAFSGQKLFGTYSLLQQSQGRIKALMVACGANLSRFVASEIMGSRLLVTVIHRQGDATTDENGNPRPAKTFANVANERPLEAPAEVQQTPPPPVMNAKSQAAKAGAGKPATNGARRA